MKPIYEITIDDALHNEYSLHLCCVSGRVFISCYDENGKHEAECNDTISYDRYNELRYNLYTDEDEQEFFELYKYFIDLCNE